MKKTIEKQYIAQVRPMPDKITMASHDDVIEIDITELTQKEAYEYAFLLSTAFIEHWKELCGEPMDDDNIQTPEFIIESY